MINTNIQLTYNIDLEHLKQYIEDEKSQYGIEDIDIKSLIYDYFDEWENLDLLKFSNHNELIEKLIKILN